MGNRETIEHFRQGREALIRKRRDIDRAIADLDRIMELFGADEPGLAPVLALNMGSGPVPTVRQAILQVLSDGRGHRATEIVTELAARPLQQAIRKKLPKSRFIVAELVFRHKDGWLDEDTWDFINNPRRWDEK